MGGSISIDLSGVGVLVTGGSSGLGRVLTEKFLAAGAAVVTCARRTPAVEIRAGDRTATFLPADLRDPEAARGVVEAAANHLGRLDVVINNAGGSPPAAAADVSARFVTAIVGLNLLAPFYVAQRANELMAAQPGGGLIINIGSVSGQRPSPGTAIYGAAKAGLRSLTTTLAMEWAPAVRVNLVTVGLLRTDDPEGHYGGAAGVAAAAATVPIGRLAEPADVGAVCLYLASPAATHLTGADISVHGGGEPPAFLAAVSATLAT